MPPAPLAKNKKPRRDSLCAFTSRIRFLLVRKPGQIVHAGVQRLGHPLALLEAQVPLAPLDLGVGALVDTRQHLHFHLCIAPLFAKLPNSAQFHHPMKLCQFVLLIIGSNCPIIRKREVKINARLQRNVPHHGPRRRAGPKHPHRGPAKVRGDVPGRPGRRGLTHATQTFLDFPTAFPLFFRLFLLYSRKRRRFA